MANTGENRTWTVLELLNWTADYFRRLGLENPRLNAEVLLGKVLGLERIMLYARFDTQVGERERDEFRALVRRRADREPLQYLLGAYEFYGRRFELTPAVLIPRQETELVVEKCLEKLAADAPLWTADIGAGSGAIAVTLAAERPALHVIATDLSAEALAVACRNASAHGVSKRVITAQGDLAAPVRDLLPGDRAGLDLLVSNPPYVPTGAIEGLEPEVRDHEPRGALDGGPDGLDVVRRLIPEAADLLAAGGWMVLEVGEGQAGPVQEMAAGTGAFDMNTIERMTDTHGCERVFCVRRRPSEDCGRRRPSEGGN
jgi:release factor glutamine methyltransferase